MGASKRSSDVREYTQVINALSREQPDVVVDHTGTWWPTHGLWAKVTVPTDDGSRQCQVRSLACGYGCKCRHSGKFEGLFHTQARMYSPTSGPIDHVSERVYPTPREAYVAADQSAMRYALDEARKYVDAKMAVHEVQSADDAWVRALRAATAA